jgi:hypothetical protein
MDDATEYTGPSNIGTTRWNPQVGVYYKGASTKPSYRPTMTPDIVGRYVLARDYAALAAKLAKVEAGINGGENKLALALAELVRLGFDFESIVGRKLEGEKE